MARLATGLIDGAPAGDLFSTNVNLSEIAKKVVDDLVFEDKLDTGAVSHRNIEGRVLAALREHEARVKSACISAISSCTNQNALCDTDVVWMEKDEIIEACNKVRSVDSV